MPRAISSPFMVRSNLVRNTRVGVAGIGVGSVKSRLGLKRGGVGVTSLSTGVKSRLGPRGGGGGKLGKPGLNRVVDARDKINLNRIKGGRVGKSTFLDARNKIQANRLKKTSSNIHTSNARADLRDLQAETLRSDEPLRNLIITTPNTAPRGSLFQNAMNDIEHGWGYGSSMPTTNPTRMYAPEPILSRTISNNLITKAPSSGGRSTSAFGSGASGRYGSSMRSDYVSPSNTDYEYMEVDRPAVRRPLQSRLDSQFKVRVSNLQSSVTVEDVAELFSDVGDLIDAKSLGPGVAEAYYKSRADCLKAVDTYHNRLLDGRPMMVVFEDKSSSISRASAVSPLKASSLSLKSAAGATSSVKLPKGGSSSSPKIQPDLSAIHKVLFQPTSSSSVTKMLFKGGH